MNNWESHRPSETGTTIPRDRISSISNYQFVPLFLDSTFLDSYKMSESQKRREESRGNILRNHSWSNGPDSDEELAGENGLLNENISPRFASLSQSFLIELR